MSADGFRVTDGSPVIGGLHGPQLHHFHCPNCKSWMFTRVEGFDSFVTIRPTMLEDHSWFSPFIETMTREKLAWAETPARHRFEGFPPMEEFGKLIEEYSRAG